MLSGLTLRLRVRVLLALALSAVVCFVATPGVRRLAVRIGAVDKPGDPRRINDHPVPRMGGLAMFLGFIVAVLLFSKLTESIRGILYGSLVIVLLGVADDKWDLNPWIKLAGQCVAAWIAVCHGVEVQILTNPIFAQQGIDLGALSAPVTMLWIVGMTNALNLIDGLDGLAAGVAGISCASILAVSMFIPKVTDVSVLVAALGGACLGFLPYNHNPAKIFMGDTGALLLGYVLSTASVVGLFKMYTIATFAMPLLVLALPLFDTIFAIFRRVCHGKSPIRPDREHIHHRLLAMGLDQKQSVALLYAFSAILGLLAVVLAANSAARFWLLLLAVAIAVAAWIYILYLRHKHRRLTKKDTPPEQ